MSKHTPGPWKATGPSISAKGHGYIGKALEIYMDKSERHANAQLMAAAPDMLAALIQVRARFQGLRLGLDESATLDRVDAAIAKATTPAGAEERGDE